MRRAAAVHREPAGRCFSRSVRRTGDDGVEHA
jgi:hypothetical protein